LSDKLQERILLDVLEPAGLTGPEQSIPATVGVKHGQNRRGKTLHRYPNYSLDSRAFDYPYAAGTELLIPSGRERGQKITLKPRDAAIVEEK
jgi:hypothetical protein